MKIAFLLHDAYGIGGTVSATLNLAGALAKRHEVEIVSVFRTRDTPQGTVEPGVRLTPLVDIRANSADSGHQLSRRPSAVSPSSPSFSPLYNALTDQRIGSYLDGTTADVVIATRPVLLMYLAHFGERDYLRIGQEHLTHDSQIPEQRERQNQIIGDMDAFVTVSHADAEIYRGVLPHAASRILSIPNPVALPTVMPARSGQRIVVAAGRLVKVKRYDVLIRAFETVVRSRPDWTLRIYGSGKEEQSLRDLVMERGLYNHVRLMGAHAPMESEWAKGDIAAVTSDNESFGMTIVEAQDEQFKEQVEPFLPLFAGYENLNFIFSDSPHIVDHAHVTGRNLPVLMGLGISSSTGSRRGSGSCAAAENSPTGTRRPSTPTSRPPRRCRSRSPPPSSTPRRPAARCTNGR
ncbi:UDP-N-acetylglucosamine--peptide N-acetylglucosaminyltransferase GtfA subunit [Streptomyces californicus]